MLANLEDIFAHPPLIKSSLQRLSHHVPRSLFEDESNIEQSLLIYRVRLLQLLCGLWGRITLQHFETWHETTRPRRIRIRIPEGSSRPLK